MPTAPVSPPWRLDGADVLVVVRVTPRAGRDGLGEIAVLGDGAVVLTVKVRALPADGAANAAVAALVADAAGVPKSRAAVVAGPRSRVKTIRLTGAGAAGLAALQTAAAPGT